MRVLRQYLARLEWRIVGDLSGEPDIPRTHRLADVTSVKEISELRAQVERNRPLRFNCQIRDAFRRVEHAWSRKRIRRTCIETAGAAPAAIRREGLVRDEIDVEQQRSDEEERAQLRIHQIGDLAEPSKPRA